MNSPHLHVSSHLADALLDELNAEQLKGVLLAVQRTHLRTQQTQQASTRLIIVIIIPGTFREHSGNIQQQCPPHRQPCRSLPRLPTSSVEDWCAQPEKWVNSHDGPIRRRKHGYILMTDQSDAGSMGIFS
eukprot:3717558-Pyramimonas_sp.AAC.1